MEYVFYGPIFFIVIYLFLKSFHSYHMLQQNLYNENNRYLKYTLNNTFKNIKWYDYLVVFVIGAIFVDELFSFNLIIYYLLITIIYYFDKKKNQVKKPLVITKRIKRLVLTTFIVLALLIFITYKNIYILYTTLAILCMFNGYFILFIHFINLPLEKLIYWKFYRKARRKIESMNSLNIIGITGSYGKTSCKNIVYDILSTNNNVLMSPKSINTFNGLMMVINNKLDKLDDIFIAELGAYVVGEIKSLCKLVTPTVGILTNIGQAHLETFKTQENVQTAKFELIESLPKNGLAILNSDDEYQRNYKIKNEVNKVWIGINNDADFKACNIKQSPNGMSFEVEFSDLGKKIEFKTKLLGYNNVYNILSAIALGYNLGIEMKSLQISVENIRPIEHRLEMKKYKHINIIDDAYNSNPVGSKMALDVLDLMPGKKIIVTPGMIELGKEQYNKNFEFGESISKVCDEVILIGEQQTKPIYDGLIKHKYNNKKIVIFNDVKEAFSYVEKYDNDTYVLLENDLPDIFNEGRK